MTSLYWLPDIADWRTRLRALSAEPAAAWQEAVTLANARLDFTATNALDTMLRGRLGDTPPPGLAGPPLRLALLGSATLAQLAGGIRVGCLRRGLHATLHEGGYGQYWAEIADAASPLHAFRPDTVVLALDAHHIAAGVTAAMPPEAADAALAEVMGRVRDCWRRLRAAFGCQIIHQLPLPVLPHLLGHNEHRLPGSPAGFVARASAALRAAADADGVDILDLSGCLAADGLGGWHDTGLWHRAKQEISPVAAPRYGEQVARLVAARRGRAFKCLVLDLDNTLWGGVIGDDGLACIVLGQGSALGEAYVAFQSYVRDLSRRGVILAVCSKNDPARALEPFERHPDMVLRRDDIACFVANWTDKPANLREIARTLNIGLDALVFADDNPFERALVRQELPMVAVPELSDEPASYPRTIADAGYFEALAVTGEDRARAANYQGNRQRAAWQGSATDLPSYLRGLQMRLLWRRFDAIGLPRVVQLINKTNQFNLTTRRYSEAEVAAVMDDARAFGLQLRLLDRFGDNGIIAVVIGRMLDGGDLLIDTWLMSCRVLGRQVEPATLGLVAAQARMLGARRLVGEYRPTEKNAMVREHYAALGFAALAPGEAGARWALDLDGFVPGETFIDVREG